MSAIDLYTLWSYSRKNPAILSILISSQENCCRAFSLTPLGQKAIGECRQTGYHQHSVPDDKLYTDSPNAVDDETTTIIVVDYRIQEE